MHRLRLHDRSHLASERSIREAGCILNMIKSSWKFSWLRRNGICYKAAATVAIRQHSRIIKFKVGLGLVLFNFFPEWLFYAAVSFIQYLVSGRMCRVGLHGKFWVAWVF